MNQLKSTVESPMTEKLVETRTSSTERKPVWETPKLEDVSEQVMAQPYIRFT